MVCNSFSSGMLRVNSVVYFYVPIPLEALKCLQSTKHHCTTEIELRCYGVPHTEWHGHCR